MKLSELDIQWHCVCRLESYGWVPCNWNLCILQSQIKSETLTQLHLAFSISSFLWWWRWKVQHKHRMTMKIKVCECTDQLPTAINLHFKRIPSLNNFTCNKYDATRTILQHCIKFKHMPCFLITFAQTTLQINYVANYVEDKTIKLLQERLLLHNMVASK